MSEPPKTESDVFFATHAVFTTDEFDAFLAARSTEASAGRAEARQTLLRHHLKHQKILRVRRGLYASVPAGHRPDSYPVDSYLIAARLTKDGVLAYHTALALHGLAQSVREERITLSGETASRSFRFRGILYRTLAPPAELPLEQALSFGVETMDRQGMSVRVTSVERTLVDAFDRLKLCGGWEEVWRSLEGLDLFLDFSLITRYVSLLDNATTAAKVGFFLERFQDRLQVPASALEALQRCAPKQPHYVERGRRSEARLVSRWNLLIPANFEATNASRNAVGEDIPR